MESLPLPQSCDELDASLPALPDNPPPPATCNPPGSPGGMILPPALIPDTAPLVAETKNQTVLPIFEALKSVIDKKVEDGSLAEELGAMKASQLINLIAKMAATVRGAAVNIHMGAPPPQVPNPDKLRKFSPLMTADGDRANLHKRADKLGEKG